MFQHTDTPGECTHCGAASAGFVNGRTDTLGRLKLICHNCLVDLFGVVNLIPKDEVDAVRATVKELNATLQAVGDELDATRKQRDASEIEVERVKGELSTATHSLNTTNAAYMELRKERDALADNSVALKTLEQRLHEAVAKKTTTMKTKAKATA